MRARADAARRSRQALAGSALDDFGYERSDVPSTVRARAEASAWRLRLRASAGMRTARAKAAGAWGSVSR